MVARSRLEDIGRLCQMIKEASDSDVFNWLEGMRSKDACDWFEKQTPEKKDDIIHKMAYGLEDLQSKLNEAYCLARWGDDLDED